MTSFVDDNGNYLDYSGEDIAITKRAVSIYEFKLRGDITQDFDLDNNSINRLALGYFGVNQVNSPAMSQLPFNMIRNGNFIMRGYFVIRGDNEEHIQCFFISGNSNWFSLLETNIRDFDWNAYTIDSQNYTRSADNGMIFPIVDWMFHGEKNEWVYPTLYHTAGQNDGSEVFPSLLPCVYLKTLIDEICSQSGIKLAGNLTTDPFYKNILITPDRMNLQWPETIVNKTHVDLRLTADQVFPGVSGNPILNNKAQGSGLFEYNTTTGVYTAYYTAVYKWTVSPIYTVSQSYSWTVVKTVGTAFGAFETYVVPNTAGTNDSAKVEIWAKVTKGDQFRLFVGTAVPFTLSKGTTATVEINSSIFDPLAGTVTRFGVPIPVSAVIPDMKAIDLVKFAVSYFPSVCYFDDISNVLTINRIDGIVDSENWSSYLVNTKQEYGLVAKNNYIKYSDVDDFEIVNYNKVSATPYGGLNLQTNFNIKNDKTIYTIPFGPVRDIINQHMTWQIPSIPLMELTLDKSFNYTSVTADFAGDAEFNGAAGEYSDGTTNYFVLYNLFYVSCDQNFYSGYHTVKATTASKVTSNRAAPTGVSVGTVHNVKASFIESKHRLLYVIRDYPTYYAGGLHNWKTVREGTYTSYSTNHNAWFNKIPDGTPADAYHQSVAMDNVPGAFNRNDTVGDLFFNNVKNMFNGPLTRAMMLLPQSVFQKFDFSKMIYISAPNINGYFFVNAINNYTDPKTPVEVELLKAK
jgi:hypothetical protein